LDANALALAIALRAALPKKDVDRFLVALQEVVVGALRRNEDVAVAGFGIWHRPVRSEDTPPFEFVVPVGPLCVSPPTEFRLGDESEPEVARLAGYLSQHSILRDTFGADEDFFPDLGPNLHPGIVRSADVVAGASSGLSFSFDPSTVGVRVLQNMRGMANGRA
jgi:hypothetical protein